MCHTVVITDKIKEESRINLHNPDGLECGASDTSCQLRNADNELVDIGSWNSIPGAKLDIKKSKGCIKAKGDKLESKDCDELYQPLCASKCTSKTVSIMYLLN